MRNSNKLATFSLGSMIAALAGAGLLAAAGLGLLQRPSFAAEKAMVIPPPALAAASPAGRPAEVPVVPEVDTAWLLLLGLLGLAGLSLRRR